MYILLLAASFFAALLSGAAGFGGALLLLPVVVYVIGPEFSVPVLTIAQLIGNISRMAFGIKQIQWKPVGMFLATALPLTALGAFGFTVLPKNIVMRVIGAALILFVLLKMAAKLEFKPGKRTMLCGGAVVGLLSGLAGSAGPIGAAVFLSLGLPPVAYIASEATTATAMHLLKTVIYGSLMDVPAHAIFTGFAMGGVMVLGTFCANRFIRNMSKDKFQKYVAVVLLVVGGYMLIFGK